MILVPINSDNRCNHVKLCQNNFKQRLKTQNERLASVAISKQRGNCITTDTIKQR